MNQLSKSPEESKDPRHLEEEKLRSIVEVMVKSLVSHPEDILVKFTRGNRTTIYQVECLQRDLGQILGTKGRNIQSLRNLVAAAAATKGFRAIVEIPYFP